MIDNQLLLGTAAVKVLAGIAIYGAIPLALVMMAFGKKISAVIQDEHLKKNL